METILILCSKKLDEFVKFFRTRVGKIKLGILLEIHHEAFDLKVQSLFLSAASAQTMLSLPVDFSVAEVLGMCQ